MSVAVVVTLCGWIVGGLVVSGVLPEIVTVSALNISVDSFTTFGSNGHGIGQFSTPSGVAVGSNGLVWVTDYSNGRVVQFDPANFTGSFTSYGSAGSGHGQFYGPYGITVASSGLVWVSDYYNGRISSFDPNNFNASFTSYGSWGTGSRQFTEACGVALDSNGNVWACDFGKDRIARFNSTNFYETFTTFGSMGVGGSQKFLYPESVFVDSSNTVWVADGGNRRIVSFNPAVSNGWAWQTYTAPSGFQALTDAVVDSFGNVWGVDSGSGLVFTFNRTDVSGTFATYQTTGIGNGIENGLNSITVDALNQVWISDEVNSRIIRLTVSQATPTTTQPPAPTGSYTTKDYPTPSTQHGTSASTRTTPAMATSLGMGIGMCVMLALLV